MLKLLSKYANIIKEYRIVKYERAGPSFRLRTEITLLDDSVLYIRETVIKGEARKYSYHWQDKSKRLLIRWDNAPDWDVKTFPHHKHIGNELNVEASYERTLEQVFKVIARKF
ncbi:MAG: DUF6516 family protein [Candidatus Aerophobetes bacterium]|nr:DUF6516 family protein [Candidatus Aerophobetes bacterium]